MNLARYNQPLPPRVGQILLLLNASVLLVTTSTLLVEHPRAAAIVLLFSGILNQAVQIFIGQNPHPTPDEQTTDSTLSDRRSRVRKEKTKAGNGNHHH